MTCLAIVLGFPKSAVLLHVAEVCNLSKSLPASVCGGLGKVDRGMCYSEIASQNLLDTRSSTNYTPVTKDEKRLLKAVYRRRRPENWARVAGGSEIPSLYQRSLRNGFSRGTHQFRYGSEQTVTATVPNLF